MVGTAHAVGQAVAVELRVIRVGSNSTVATLTEWAAGRDELPDAIRREALKVREALGQATDTLSPGRVRVRPITTPSMASGRLVETGMALRAGDFPDLAAYARAEEDAYRSALTADGSNLAARFLLGRVLSDESTLRNATAKGLNPAALMAEAANLRDTARTDTATPLERDLISLWVHHDRAGAAVGDVQREEALQAAAAIDDALAIDPSDPFELSPTLHSLYSAFLGRPFDGAMTIARSADARPLNIEANAYAAAARLGAGDISGAARYAQIAQRTAVTTRQSGPSLLVLFPTYEAWIANNPERALSEIDGVLAHDVDARTRTDFAVEVTDHLLSMGLVGRAATVAAQTPDQRPGMRVALIAQVRAAAGDIEALRGLLSANPSLLTLQTDYCVAAGLLDNAHELLDAGRLQARSERLLRAQVALHDGDAAAALENGNAARDLFATKPIARLPFEMRTVEIIGLALNGLDRPGEAIDLLNRYAGSRLMAYSELPGENYGWLRLRLVLAESYQKAGQIGAARRIENDLLTQLRLADSTFPELVKLKQLMGG